MIEGLDLIMRGIGRSSDAASSSGSAEARLKWLLRNLVMPTPYVSGYESDTTAAVATMGFFKTGMLTDPGTTLTTAIDLAGNGYCAFLRPRKPSTTNSVSVHLELTVDGVVVVNDSSIFTAAVGEKSSTVIGASSGIGPVLVPFASQFKVRLRFSGISGNNANISLFYLAFYR